MPRQTKETLKKRRFRTDSQFELGLPATIPSRTRHWVDAPPHPPPPPLFSEPATGNADPVLEFEHRVAELVASPGLLWPVPWQAATHCAPATVAKQRHGWPVCPDAFKPGWWVTALHAFPPEIPFKLSSTFQQTYLAVAGSAVSSTVLALAVFLSSTSRWQHLRTTVKYTPSTLAQRAKRQWNA